jgi:hypothetical protein
MPDHEDVDRVLALHDEAVALVQGPGAAALQDVQPKRAVVLARAELPPQDERSDPPSLAIGPEIEVLDPQRAVIRAYRDGARLLAVDQHDLGHGGVEGGQEALPDPDRVEAAQALKIGAQHQRPQLRDPLRVTVDGRARRPALIGVLKHRPRVADARVNQRATLRQS